MPVASPKMTQEHLRAMSYTTEWSAVHNGDLQRLCEVQQFVAASLSADTVPVPRKELESALAFDNGLWWNETLTRWLRGTQGDTR